MIRQEYQFGRPVPRNIWHGTRWLLLFIVGMALMTASYFFPPPWIKKAPAAILAYTVVIHPDKDSMGSGTIIGHAVYKTDGKPVTFSLILTCQHVVSETKAVRVHYGGRDFDGTVVAVDNKLDLALILVKEHWPAAPLHFGTVSEGEEEIVAGSPLDTAVVLTQGMVGPMDEKLDHSHFTRQGSAAVWPGNSGGGVYVLRGTWKLAGVAEMVHTVGGRPRTGQFFMMPPQLPQLASTVSYSITMSDVAAFLHSAGYK